MLGGESAALSGDDLGGTEINELDDSVVVQQDI